MQQEMRIPLAAQMLWVRFPENAHFAKVCNLNVQRVCRMRKLLFVKSAFLNPRVLFQRLVQKLEGSSP